MFHLEERVDHTPAPTNLHEDDKDFKALLTKISARGSLNCQYYRDSYLKRRIQARMVSTGTKTFSEYADFLERTAGEYDSLIDAIGTNVTEFFRDKRVFETLRTQIVPEIAENRTMLGGRRLRIWSACCATGEEPYSVAMTLREALGERMTEFEVQIFATDIDDDALARAQRGIYSLRAAAKVPPRLLARYFDAQGDAYRVKDTLRSMVTFSKLEMFTGRPLVNIDLLLCRNMLIYIHFDQQAPLFEKFHASLRPGGCLVLGSTERLPDGFSQKFSPVRIEDRIYKKI